MEFSIYYKGLLAEAGVSSEILDLSTLPQDFVFTALYENGGKNAQFNSFRKKVEETEKFIFIVPEYNGSFPGILKSFIDGLQYPDSFTNKKALLIGISSGMQGGAIALSHLNDILSYLNMHVYGTRLKIPLLEKSFVDGKIIDSKILSLAKIQLEGFKNF